MFDLFASDEFAKMDPTEFVIYMNIGRLIESDDPVLVTFAFDIISSKQGYYDNNLGYIEYLNYLKKIFEEEKELLALSVFSLYSHEVRHYHDLLLTLYGSMIKRQAIRFQTEFLYCEQDILFNNKSLYVPFSEWLSNKELLSGYFADLHPPSKGVQRLVEIFEAVNRKLMDFNCGIIPPVRPETNLPDATGILEGLAILVQEADIRHKFGAEWTDRFHRGMHKSSLGKNYYKALSRVSEAFGYELPHEITTYILLAALSGNFQDPRPIPRHPADLLFEILLWLRQKNYPRPMLESFEAFTHIIDEFFINRDGLTFAEHLNQASKANRLLEKEINADKLAPDAIAAGIRMDLLFEEFNLFCEIHEQFVGQFLEDPLSYCSPETYFLKQSNYTPPLFFIEAAKNGIPYRTEPLKSNLFVHHFMGLNFSAEAPGVDEILRHLGNVDVTESAFLLSFIPDASASAAFPLLTKHVEILRELHEVLFPLRIYLRGMKCGLPEGAITELATFLKVDGIKLYADLKEVKPLNMFNFKS